MGKTEGRGLGRVIEELHFGLKFLNRVIMIGVNLGNNGKKDNGIVK
jgi:hypothetical protein